MKRYLFDTGVVGDLVARRRGVFERITAAKRAGHILGICAPVLGELYAGAEMSNDPDRNRRRLVHTITGMRLWPYGLTEAIQFGRLRGMLKRIGRSMQQIDIQIAAVAMTLGNTSIVTTDSDLFAIPGLSVEDWSVPETAP
jgi:tRNA(fMet)-specific endonuclease VapC